MIKPVTHEPRLLEHVNCAINLLGASRSTNTKIAKVLSNPAEEKERGKAEEKGGRGEAKKAGGRGETKEAGGRGEAEARTARDA